jgi:hypothetical protein
VRLDVLGVRSDTLSCNSLMPRIVKTAYPTVLEFCSRRRGTRELRPSGKIKTKAIQHVLTSAKFELR